MYRFLTEFSLARIRLKEHTEKYLLNEIPDTIPDTPEEYFILSWSFESFFRFWRLGHMKGSG